MRVFFFDRFLESFRRQTGNVRQAAQNFRAFRVHLFHERIIFRHRRRGGDGVVRELFHVIELQKRIERPLVTDRAAQPIADVRAARRTAGVTGINDNAVRQLQIKFAQCFELLGRQLFRFARA